MTSFKKLHLSVLMHQHNYDKVLAETAFTASRNSKETDPDILRYQGVASFYKQNFYHSKMCYEMLDESDAMKSDDFLYLAFMQARQNERERAISSWCRSLELNKHNRYASKALSYIRSKGRELNLAEDEFFDTVVPPPPIFIRYSRVIASIIIGLFIISLGPLGAFVYREYKSHLIHKRIVSRGALDKVTLDDFNPNIIVSSKDYEQRYSYSEREIKTKFERAKQLVWDNKVVSAQIEINEIKLSNASPQVKLKSEMLQDYIALPDYGVFRNEISYEEFTKDKLRYENIYIMWTGRVVNKSIYKDKITFDLELGDQEHGTVDGIIPVVFRKAVLIDNKDTVTVFGRIAFEQTDTSPTDADTTPIKKAYIDGLNAIRR